MLMFSFLQYSLIVDRALAEINDDTQRVNLFEHLFKLCDVILNGFTAQLQSIKAVYGEVERYESIRSKYAACRKQLLGAFGMHSLSSFYHSSTCGVESDSFDVLLQWSTSTSIERRLSLRSFAISRHS